MEEVIKRNINNPKKLERLYRENPSQFKRAFFNIYSTIKDFSLTAYWRVRLDDDKKSSAQESSPHNTRTHELSQRTVPQASQSTSQTTHDVLQKRSPTAPLPNKSPPTFSERAAQERQTIHTPFMHGKNQPWFNIKVLLSCCILSVFLFTIPKIFQLNLILLGENEGDTNIAYTLKFGALILFLGLSLYMSVIRKSVGLAFLSIVISLVWGLYMYFLPPPVMLISLLPSYSDGIGLVYFHNIFLLWFLFGFIYINLQVRSYQYRIDYIRHNAHAILFMFVIIFIAVMLIALIGFLFDTVDMSLNKDNIRYYDLMVYIGVTGFFISLPIIATHLDNNNPHFAQKIMPLVAKILHPLTTLFLILLNVILIMRKTSIVEDRNALLMFNLIIFVVFALIVFFVVEMKSTEKSRFFEGLLIFTAVFVVISVLLALSLIIGRMNNDTFGLTPNRVALLIPNLLVMINLIGIIIALCRVNIKGASMSVVKISIARFLPLYGIWFIFMVFIMPLILR